MKFLYHYVNLFAIRILAVYAGVKDQSMPFTRTVSLDFVNQHNLFRQQLKTTGSDVECVKGTNSLLKNIAQRYADQCTMRKPSPDELQFSCYSKVGVAIHYDSNLLSPADVVADLLITYSDYYDFSSNKCVINGSECDSFLQASWHRMNEIGCGRSKCKSIDENITFPGYITVCAYSEAPSPSMQPYSSGKPCSTCPDSKNICVNNLCCGEQNSCAVTSDKTTSTTSTSTTSTTTSTTSTSTVTSTTPTTTTVTTSSPSTTTAKTSLSPCVDEPVCSDLGQTLCNQRPGMFLSQCRRSCQNCFDDQCYDSKDPRVDCKELSRLCPTPTRPNALVKSYCPKTCGICK